MTSICDGLDVRSVYLTTGKYYALDARLVQGVHNPDASNGWTRMLVLDHADGIHKELFYVPSLMSYMVSANCRELTLAREAAWGTKSREFVILSIHEKAKQFASYGWERAYVTASRVLSMLGAEPLKLEGLWQTEERSAYFGPFDGERPAEPSGAEAERISKGLAPGRSSTTQSVKAGKSKGGGKPAAEKVLKPIKVGSKVHAVLEYFNKEHGASVTEAMTHFKTTRSNVLSGLFLLNKNHGLGYVLRGDVAVLTVPPGDLVVG